MRRKRFTAAPLPRSLVNGRFRTHRFRELRRNSCGIHVSEAVYPQRLLWA
ncbi:hypothetical protein GLE_2993 [Lysobacter enzymogenes]|uniref:Uncharacterized protein n=1 Tax=Lysobacter enzymogenes TaxID=69 RepID=A0A0S2DIA4_LYSEN|nr:hypothetical protein GLE_2993 [Lysobacter enzymogenes]